jgi:hypothetical protein
MTISYQLATIKSALTIAFNQGFTLVGSYLDNLGAYDYALLSVLWQDHGAGDDSLLGFAEKIRNA